MIINLKKGMSKITKVLVLLLIIFSLTLINDYNKRDKTIFTSTEGLSNNKIGWGIKRNDNHEQPDLGAKNRQILERNNGIAMGNQSDKFIYLTFDEGYEAGYTPEILKKLKENNVKATFFITAHYLNTQPDLIKQMIDEGHIVGNHTSKSLMSNNLKIEKVYSNSLFIVNKAMIEIEIHNFNHCFLCLI